MERHFIFGYGSLINKASRQRTSPSAFEAFPIKIKNYTRGWFARTGVKGLSTTFLGCQKNESKILLENEKQSFVNGVIYEVQKDELPLLDIREKRYLRTKVNPKDIVSYQNDLPKNITIWIYTNDFEDRAEFMVSIPNKKFPIIQSYIDLCLVGCYEIEAEFNEAKSQNFSTQFIESISHWNKHWANDRIYPRRPHIHCPDAYKIDSQLSKLLPEDIFNAIYVE